MRFKGSLVILPVALLFLATAPTAAASEPAAPLRAAIERLEGEGYRVRDHASFRTERDEPALIVLYASEVTEPEPDAELDEPITCPSYIAGIPLTGLYHLALFIGDELVSRLDVPALDAWVDGKLRLPLRNVRWSNHLFWGQGEPVAHDDPRGRIVEPTKLLRLADYNGDGRAWELRLVEVGGACGHYQTLLAGYSARQRKLILFPIVEGAAVRYWHLNFFPSPIATPATSVKQLWPCGDHGNSLLGEIDFEYNPHIEAWVRTGTVNRLCFAGYMPGGVSPESDTEALLEIGSARGRPGDTVEVPVRLVPNGIAVSALEIDLPSDDFPMTSCWVKWSEGTGDLAPSRSGLRAVILLGGESYAMDPPPLEPRVIFTCRFAIPASQSPGAYRLAASGLRVKNEDSAWPQRARATAGEIVVLESASEP